MYIKQKIKLTIISIFLIFFCTPNFVLADVPSLQVDIPNLSFSLPTTCPNDSDKICYPWIGDYVVAIYNYAIGIVGIVAAAVLMWGGVTWLTAGGSPDKVNNAKSWITASLTGLLIAMASYTILYMINPNLVTFAPLGVTPTSSSDSQGATKGGTWLYDNGIENQLSDASNQLNNLLDCLRANLPEGVGRISSISDSNHIGSLTVCEDPLSCGSANCVHTCSSCHYGGGLGDNKSHAVDIGDEENAVHIEKAIQECSNLVGYSDLEGNHYHISTKDCPRN